MSRSRLAGTMLVAALAFATPAAAAPVTTAVRTMQDCDGDNLLEPAPGERHVALPYTGDDADCEIAQRSPFRLPQRASLLNILQLSDFQIVDEESPARVEFLDSTQRTPGANPLSAAYRPQESLTTQVTEAMVRQARNTVSPVTGARLDLAILTGDNADSQQYNETRWFIDVLDGTTGPGNPDPEMSPGTGGDRKVVPDSGIAEQVTVDNCGTTALAAYQDNGSVYDGVRGGGGPGQDTGYYNPDGADDGDGYTPDRARNAAEVPGEHADVTVRDFPGLFEAAQRPFEAVGLGMPWYSAFGNHDALIQGNSPDAFTGPLDGSAESVNPIYDGLARGCVKPSKLGTSLGDFLADPLAALDESDPVTVPPDPRRCYVAKDVPNDAAAPCDTGGWIQQHSRTTGMPVGHGFEPFSLGGQAGEGRPQSARENHDGYYAFTPKPGYRFVVLDTITDECGSVLCSEGTVDDAQFQWVDGELEAAEAAGQRVIVFSHHTLRTTRFASTDPTELPLHPGERLDRMSSPPSPVRPDAAPETTLEDLWCRHPSVLAHVVGHEHANYVLPHGCEDPGQGTNAFYEVSTSAHIDWPQQSRTIELVNDGGELALVLTVIDHAGAPKPDGRAEEPVKLASVAREIAYNDYQNIRAVRGDRADRNVIVPLGRPAQAAGLLALDRTLAVRAGRRFTFPFAATPGSAVKLDVLAARGVRIGRTRLTVPATGRARAGVRLTRRGAALVRSHRRTPVVLRASLRVPGRERVARRRARVTLLAP